MPLCVHLSHFLGSQEHNPAVVGSHMMHALAATGSVSNMQGRDCVLHNIHVSRGLVVSRRSSLGEKPSCVV